MNTISEILQNSYSDQGLQSLKVFYDSIVFDLKVKDDTANYNVLLIEKFAFDYQTETIKRLKNGVTINFGDTGSDIPNESNGNCFVESVLDRPNKNLFVVGLKQMANGNTIPIIYSYNINKHTSKPIFPKPADVENFNSFDNKTFLSTAKPFVKYYGSRLYIMFQTNQGPTNYINRLVFNTSVEGVELLDYKMVSYGNDQLVEFTNTTKDAINFKLGNKHGLLKLRSGFTSDLQGLTLDDDITFLMLDDDLFSLSIDI